ncbi:MAG: hypothetical protein UV64_C0007G0036 [Parcubacteria group bacterium GW2011_GWC1_43_11b]|nr:MAG: hypothetical protein UV64_C0007G0036 [Parcubacteria group bacterium GW2011_GWC1_43_11b]
MQTLEYPLSPKYIPNWTVVEALRELLANALDTKTKISVKYHKSQGQATISDQAAGIPRPFWVFGEGNHGEIGQFGEGLKLALLVLARENVPVVVSTVGYDVSPRMQYSTTYETNVLALDVSPNGRTAGTEITVTCTKEIFLTAKNLFLELTPKEYISKRLGILKESGVLYINGVFVQKMEKCLWGYNITTKVAANRDRSILDIQIVQGEISKKITSIASIETLAHFIKCGQESPIAESGIYMYPSKTQKLWKTAFIGLYGKKACISDSPVSDSKAIQMGWRPIPFPYYLANTLNVSRVKRSSEIPPKVHKPLKLASPLTEAEKKVLKIAREVSQKVVPDAKISQVRIVESISNADNAQNGLTTVGLYKKGIVYLSRENLGSIGSATAVLIHERLHGKGFKDGDIAFEGELTFAIGKAMMEVMKK